MAIINRLKFVDILKQRLGDRGSREFVDALQDEVAPLVTKQEIQMIIAGLVDQFESRMWRVVAVATGLQLTALGIVAGVIIAVNN